MNTRFRGRRNTTTRPAQHGHAKLRIIIVETTTGNEVQLCSGCTHRIDELQHEDAVFNLKSEYESFKNESMEDEYGEDIDVNAIDDAGNEIPDSLAKKERNARPQKSQAKRRFGYDDMMVRSGNQLDIKYPVQPKKVIFPESEYDVLEKKLIELEVKLSGAKDEEFKKLCKTGVLCEERWATLYCRDYNKPLDNYRNEAISVLKHNLDIRRGEGVRPSIKLQTDTPRQIKRDVTTVNPSVGIASGQIGNPQNLPREFMRGSSKRNFGTCLPITALTMGPLHNYSNIPNDPCYMIENVLFDVESRLKRCNPDSKEYRELIEEGRRLREEWTQANEQMRDNKTAQEHPAYDISKCVVLGRTRRSRISNFNEEDVEVEQ